MSDRSLVERIAALETKQDVMGEDILDIKRELRQLTALANKGRGSLATMLWVGGFVSAAVGFIGSLIGYMKGMRP